MGKIDVNEYLEDNEELVEVELGEGILLPSQTRNPQFGIWPSLQDDECVIRYPLSNNRTVNRMKDSNNPEVSKLYCLFVFPAIIYGQIYRGKPEQHMISRINSTIRDGTFSGINELVKINPSVLSSYLPESTYKSIQHYQRRTR